MTDLVAFLRARLDEDEAAAKACAEMFPAPWEVADRGWRVRIYSAAVPDVGDHAEPGDMRAPCVIEVEPDRHHNDTRWLSERVDHITRHDPARVLADVEAKRRIVEQHVSWAQVDADGGFSIELYGERYCRTCSDDDTSWWNDKGKPEWPCATLRLLALPYADHPDYDEAWRP